MAKELNPVLFSALQRYAARVGSKLNVLRRGQAANLQSAFDPITKRTKWTGNAGESYVIDCPVCGGRQKLHIAHFFGNKTHGSGLGFIYCHKTGNMCFNTIDARERFRDRLFVADRALLLTNAVIAQGEVVVSTPLPLPDDFKEIHELQPTHEARWFFSMRDFDVEDLKAFRVGYTASGALVTREDGSTFRFCPQHVVVPFTSRGVAVGWQGRFLGPPSKTHPKWKTALGTKKSMYLYNYDRAKSASTILLTEGAKDVWRFPDHGMAMCGVSPSDTQLEALKTLADQGKTLVLAFDSDVWSFSGGDSEAAARHAQRMDKCRKTADALSLMFNGRFLNHVIRENHGSPADFDRDWFFELLTDDAERNGISVDFSAAARDNAATPTGTFV